MLGGILWNAGSFFLLFALIGLLALQEYFRLIGKTDEAYAAIAPWHRTLVVLMGVALFLLFAGSRLHFAQVEAGFAGMWLLILLFLILALCEILLGNNFQLKILGYSLLGLLYAVLPLCLLVDLRLERSWNGFPLIPLGLILCIWINDTMAYIVGSLTGRTPFFPAISPKKTWEGTIGGILLTVLAAGLFGYFGHYYRIADWIIIGLLAAVAGTAGDLAESKLKRMAGVKDSGSLLPGHGGFLDRFDSLLFAAPFVWLYVRLWM